MSVDLFVTLAPAAMPSPAEWQAAITAHGFPLQMDTDFDVVTHTGYLPCHYNGDLAGFEYYYNADPDPQAATVRVHFVTHSDLTEFLGSIIAAAVLAKLSGGTLEDPQSGETVTGDDAIAWAKSDETEILQDPNRLPLLSEDDSQLLEDDPAPPPKPWWKFW